MRPHGKHLGLAAVAFSVLSVSASAQPVIDFNRDVRPILGDTCFKCHGPDKNTRKADLRLDTPEGASAKRDEGVPIIAGKPADSLVYQRLITKDADELMPPPKAKLPLTPKQIETIRLWIEQGAKYQPHWAYLPVKQPAPPAVKNEKWIRNSIDRFVLAKLEAEGLSPTEQASKETLIRRVTLDLTGLPPTLEEIDAFLSDASPNAYEKVVDRLLASPAFGERMAWDWLDAARYADSNGYQGDGERTMWPWRDWVIDAFNRNMPFDQFTVEQLAGDLMGKGQGPRAEGQGPEREGPRAKGQGPQGIGPSALGPTPSALPIPSALGPLPSALSLQLATGFNRNHMINGEGGRIAEENRIEYLFDQTETVGTIWLGMTFNCSRCHDHKFDPLLRKDYYSLMAFFNQTPVDGGGGNPSTPPVVEIVSAQQQAAINENEQKIKSLDAAIAARAKETAGQRGEQEKQAIAALEKDGWRVLTPTAMKADHQTLKLLDDQSILAGGVNPKNDTYHLTFTTDQPRISALRLEALRHETMTHGGLGRSDSGNFVLTEISVEVAGKPVKIAAAEATFEQGNLKIAAAFDGKPDTGWAVWDGKPVSRDHEGVFRFADSVEAGKGTVVTITLRHDSPHASHNLGRFRLSVTEDANAKLSAGRQSLIAALRTPAEKRSKAQAELVESHLGGADEATRKLRGELDQAKKALDNARKAAVKVMVMQDMAKPRKTFMLDKGLYNKPGEEVAAATPLFLPAMDSEAPRNRLGLARWLVSPENPLTSRVIVNRFWTQFFGIGIVKTTEDFGVQGETPRHQDLLDWLAGEFMRTGWDVKSLCKTIVTSATYQQSSRVTPQLIERDPENRLMARAARFRMPSWMLRDQALAAGGLMVRELGGPPVKPYQPAGVWEDATFGGKRYQQDKGDALYRRSLYVFWRRIVGPTMFFDSATRQVCTVKQVRTNSPLHALTTLNDIAFVEAARNLAQRVLLQSEANDEAKLDRLYRFALARRPSADERKVLVAAIARYRQHFAANAAAAKELLNVGDSPREEKLDAVEHAAWTALANAVMNLDEALTKE